jgi:hypothetical protein
VEAAFERGAGFMDTALAGQWCQLFFYITIVNCNEMITFNLPTNEEGKRELQLAACSLTLLVPHASHLRQVTALSGWYLQCRNFSVGI